MMGPGSSTYLLVMVSHFLFMEHIEMVYLFNSFMIRLPHPHPKNVLFLREGVFEAFVHC